METLHQSLSERVEEILGDFDHRSLLSTTGVHSATAELAGRTRRLELALREIALEVQSLASR
jgi:hypothetical protein